MVPNRIKARKQLPETRTQFAKRHRKRISIRVLTIQRKVIGPNRGIPPNKTPSPATRTRTGNTICRSGKTARTQPTSVGIEDNGKNIPLHKISGIATLFGYLHGASLQ